MLSELLLFGSSFGVVFALGFQSLSVNAGHYRVAFVNSMVVSSFNLFLWKLAPAVHTPTEVASYLLGGSIGMMCAMRSHKAMRAWLLRKKEPPAEVISWPALHYDELPGGMSGPDRLDDLIEWDKRGSVGRYGGGRYGAR